MAKKNEGGVKVLGKMDAKAAIASKVTGTIQILNDGLDAKKQVVVTCYNSTGGSIAFEAAVNLAKGARNAINISAYGLPTVLVSVMYRGQDGIGRTHAHVLTASPGKYYSSFSVWFFDVGNNVEELICYGREEDR